MKTSALHDVHLSSVPSRLLGALLALCFMLWGAPSHAEPAGRLLRVDPRASLNGGDPVITTVIEMSQSRRISEAIQECAALKGNAQLGCMSRALEQPGALYTTLPFPEKNALFTVEIDGSPQPAQFVSQAKWGESASEPYVGTAWLILVDADQRMGRAFRDARQLAGRFVAAMGPNDIVNLMFFNDRQVVRDSKWLPASKSAQAKRLIDAMDKTYSSQGRNRSLLTIIKTAATDAFRSLGNVGSNTRVPMHQAMVVLSSGFGGTDPSTSGPGALQLQQYMTAGRFPPENTALPKSPVPVISVYFPHRSYDEFRTISLDFMQNLANPTIGGFFSVMQAGEGERSDDIVQAVRRRFALMNIVRWKVSCIAPTLTQTFGLAFRKVNPPVAGDTTFKDVPLGIDPTDWPLDIDRKQTIASLGDGLYPGGELTVYGNFCWGGDSARAEAYFLPAGSAPPKDLDSSDLESARRAQKQLIAQGMRGKALEVNDAFARFEVPDSDKLVHGSGSRAVARLVVYDNRAARTSGATADTILELPATTAPFPIMLGLSVLFGLTVCTLLLILVLRRGGERSRRPAPGPAPAPVAAKPARGKATLMGAAGVFSIAQGQEVMLGRDAARCAIVLEEASVSGVHASLKLDSGVLWVRDEQSNNGTFVNGTRAASGQWVELRNDAAVKFGPCEFRVSW